VDAEGKIEKRKRNMIWILFIVTMALSLWAAWRVKAVYARYNQGVVRSGLTGAEVAAEILRRTGIRDVDITIGEGLLGDHYDPLHKRLVLSPDNFHGCTPAALGVAAHEAGHAIQHAVTFAPPFGARAKVRENQQRNKT
jgi:Zn-dependent membrane protease YugP